MTNIYAQKNEYEQIENQVTLTVRKTLRDKYERDLKSLNKVNDRIISLANSPDAKKYRQNMINFWKNYADQIRESIRFYENRWGRKK